MSPQDPHTSPSLLPQRNVLRLRRRSDKVWFAATCFCALFSVTVFIYKLKFEAPDVVYKDGGAPASAFPAASSETPSAEPAPEDAPPPPEARAVPEETAPPAEHAPAPVKTQAATKIAKAPAPKKTAAPEIAKKPLPPPAPKKAVKESLPAGVIPLDDCESTGGWATARDQGATLTLTPGTGRHGNALVLNYEWKGEKWVAVRKAFPVTLSSSQGGFYLSIRGEGSVNTLEFKITDKDGSNFGKTFRDMTGAKEWKEIHVPLSDLNYLWGGNSSLDMAHIRFIDIAVSGADGRGSLFIDDIRYRK